MDNQNIDLNILKAICTDYRLATEFFSNCKSEVIEDKYLEFTEVIRKYIALYKEAPTRRVLEEQSTLKFDKIKIVQIFDEVIKHKYDNKEFLFDLKNIKDRYAIKSLDVLKEILNNKPDDVEKFLNDVTFSLGNIKNLYSQKTYSEGTVKDGLEQFRASYHLKKNNPELAYGIKCGYKEIDELFGGFRPGNDLILIAGDTNSGKSLITLNMLINMWLGNNKPLPGQKKFNKGYHTILVSLEMSREKCEFRLFAKLAGINYKKLVTSTLDVEETKRLAAVVQFIREFPYSFYILDVPKGASVEFIANKVKELKQEKEYKILGVDYLQLLSGDENEDDHLKLGLISEELFKVVRSENLVGITPVQTNRLPQGHKGPTAGPSRIARSNLILQNASVSFQIEIRENEHLFPDFRLVNVKNRDGAKFTTFILKKNYEQSSILDPQDEQLIYNDDISGLLESFEKC